MIMKMLKPKRHPDEIDADFFSRINRNISKAMDKHNVTSWDVRAKEMYFRWAGQVARAEQYDP